MWSKKWLFFVAAFAVPMMMTAAEEVSSFQKRATEVARKLQSGDEAGAIELLRKMEQEGLAPEKPHEITLNGKKREMSLLMTAVQSNNLPVVRYLTEKGADVDFLAVSDGKETMTPLCLALNVGGFDVAKYLIQEGADVTQGITMVYDGKTFEEMPLALALQTCSRRAYDLPFLQFLLESGAEPMSKTCLVSRNTENPQSLYCLLTGDAEAFALQLIEAGAEPAPAKKPSSMTNDGKIQFCLFRDYDKVLGDCRAQLAAGADPNSPDQFGELAKLGRKAIPVFEYLRRHGADLSKCGLNALYWAADVELAGYLISHGVPADGVQEIRYREGSRETVVKRSPLSGAVEREKPEMVRYLLENGAPVRSEGAPAALIRSIRVDKGEVRDAIARAFAARGMRFTEEEVRTLSETPGAVEYARKEGLIP